MAVLSIIISIIALICAYAAYAKAGGSLDDLKRTVDDLGLNTENLRMKTAGILESLEKKVRGDEKKTEDPPRDKDDSQQAALNVSGRDKNI